MEMAFALAVESEVLSLVHKYVSVTLLQSNVVFDPTAMVSFSSAQRNQWR